MRSTSALAVAGLGILMAVTACGGAPDPGNPATSTGGPSSAAPTTTTKAASTRPRAVKLDGVQPCSLLTAAQQKQFKTDPPQPGTDKTNNAPMCDFLTSSGGGGYQLDVVTNDGIDSWTNGSRPGNTKQLAPVEGFPAISHTVDGTPMLCWSVVDVADNQSLVVEVTVISGSESEFPEKCEAARQFADAAMKTLLATH